MSTLYIIGAPADNLEDMSLEALRILGEVDFILSQEVRLAGKLLARYKIKTPLVSYNQSGGERQIKEIASWLAAGKNVALVSETGLPGISDLGGKLAFEVIKISGGLSGAASVELIPSLSAITAALALSGLTADKFLFLGRPPHNRDRPDFIWRVLESDCPAVVYEAKSGLLAFLKELKKAARENRAANKRGELELRPINLTIVAVHREPVKMRETVYRGEIERIIEKIKENKDDSKGEFMVIVGK